ncbi:uncharacterized protein EAE98_011502 [Botrytis deweyae]|uniref:Uncharacterized protein n=2 Tax=Botrytis TaxID=33196 RepID=A0A4Z1JIS0_9HELO|nr:uncharacterized protein EAE98_011502 [Botrytis deweyae]KAF7909241.1 hypothetical protein EAE99_011456 [Botrytis elliptica]KAF7913477.1 hypothetical protein EAE98_011502 [Botrytis deweyae]TGO73605.1 hypothetical protein BELL_0347g00070 [Botrytis elliptica]
MARSSEPIETTIAPHDSIDRKSKRTNSWETKNAIVYDVSLQKLLKTKREAIEADHTRIKIPKRPLSPLQKDNVRISMPLNSAAGSDILAEVKLSSLGLKVAFERYRGNIAEIWVKGMPQYVL